MRSCSARTSRTGSRPSTAIEPLSGARRPSTHSMVVVLPAPLGPMRPKISPRATSKLTPSTASVRPYDLRRACTRMTGSDVTSGWTEPDTCPFDAAVTGTGA